MRRELHDEVDMLLEAVERATKTSRSADEFTRRYGKRLATLVEVPNP